MGFEELQHTADWAMRVWAIDLPSLFVEAAQGMNAMTGVRLDKRTKVKRTFHAEAADKEGLLVIFLSELVFCHEEYLGFDEFEVALQENNLQVNMQGAPIASISKTIKAVTYHNLQIKPTETGFEVEIVFDV